MLMSIAVVASDTATRERLVALVPASRYSVASYAPDALPDALPQLFVLALPGINTPEEQLIEQLRSDDVTAAIPIVLVSPLPMVQLQSLPYAGDWTIAIVEEPVDAAVLLDTMGFLLKAE